MSAFLILETVWKFTSEYLTALIVRDFPMIINLAWLHAEGSPRYMHGQSDNINYIFKKKTHGYYYHYYEIYTQL